ncbi:response regulator, partial [Lysobacter enzymogenes]|uniref:response regulator n=1 Tax=Lysobacter enzymogenes TaxID=69 RepID=UPI0019D1AD2C
PAPAPPPAIGAPAPGRGETVLVVEDDAAVRAIALAFLRASGYRAVAVGSAAEALRYLAGDGEAAAMFSDVMLGEGMNGKELAAAARRLRPRLPVLLTSGYETQIASAGEAFELLRKPYRREQVAAAIARAIAAAGDGG